MIEKIYLKRCKVLLDDLGNNAGEVTVIGDMRTYSYYWGSMADSLKDFLIGTSPSYFASKLIHYNDENVFDAKGTISEVRRYIREDLIYDLPWYNFMSAQKELREKLKELEQCSSQEEFVHEMSNLTDGLDCDDLTYLEGREFRSLLDDTICTEPWHFIRMKHSREYKNLESVLPELQKILKKQKKLANVNI